MKYIFGWRKFNENIDLVLETPEEKEAYIRENIKAINIEHIYYEGAKTHVWKLEVPFSSNFSLGITIGLNDNGTADIRSSGVVFSKYYNKALKDVLERNNIEYTNNVNIGVAGVDVYNFTRSENNNNLSLNIIQEIYNAVVASKKGADSSFGDYMKNKGGSNSGIGNMD